MKGHPRKSDPMGGYKLAGMLSVITWIGIAILMFLGKDGTFGLIPFLCLLPMCFYMTARSFSERCSVLEKRIEELETVIQRMSGAIGDREGK